MTASTCSDHSERMFTNQSKGVFNPPEGEDPSVKISAPFTYEQMALVIGKEGANFIKFTEESGAKYIWYFYDLSEVHIWGSPEASCLAEKLVRVKLEHVTAKRSHPKDPTSTFKFELDPQHIGRLIGAKGQNLLRIQNISGAKFIKYAGDNQVHIWGSPEAAARAEKMVLDTIDQILNKQATPLRGAPAATFKVEIEPRKIGHLIGAKGSNLLRIREMSGAKHIKYSSENSEVQVWGTPSACCRAEALIREKIASIA